MFLMLLVLSRVSTSLSGLSLAFRQPTEQSSTHLQYGASLAVDGALDKNKYEEGSCTHTANHATANPWWRVDLGRAYYVSVIRVTNRGDCCGGRLANFEIRIGNSLINNGNNNPQCGEKHNIPQGQTSSIQCTPSLLGRYVNIQIPGSGRILTLCEVLVNPPVSRNLATSKPTTQSSQAANSPFGVDGLYALDSPCTHTDIGGEMSPWWRVDLQQVEPVSEVYIVSNMNNTHAERLWNIEVRVGNSTANGGVSNTRCGDLHSVPGGKGMSIFCYPRIYGRYVYIRRPGVYGVLTLCEAPVYSESRPVIVEASPANMTAFEDEPISLHCKAPSFPRPQITWNLDGAILPYTGQIIEKKAQKSDSGVYECTVSSVHGRDMHTINLIVEAAYKVCSNVEVLSDVTRSATSTLNTRRLYVKDDNIASNKWYRFEGSNGTPLKIPLTSIPEHSCGTLGSGWMQGNLPTLKDGIVKRSVCFHLDGNICYVSKEIMVRKCLRFYIYKLIPTQFYGRYCAVIEDQQDIGYEDDATLAFTCTREKTALINHVIYNITDVPDMVSCFTYCALVPECLSFNFVVSLSKCQLNNALAKQYPQDLHHDVSYSGYYDAMEINVY